MYQNIENTPTKTLSLPHFKPTQKYNIFLEKNQHFDERIKIFDERTKISDERIKISDERIKIFDECIKISDERIKISDEYRTYSGHCFIKSKKHIMVFQRTGFIQRKKEKSRRDNT